MYVDYNIMCIMYKIINIRNTIIRMFKIIQYLISTCIKGKQNSIFNLIHLY